MKAYQSIEELAEDAKISERTAWRWLKDGRIKKKKSEDGQTVFILTTDIPADNGVSDIESDIPEGVTTDTSVDVSDSEIVSKPISRHRFSRRATAMSTPSPELQKEEESAEISELRVRKAKAESQLNKITEDKRREREKLEEMEKRRKWMNYGLKLFGHEADLETKLRIKKAVSMILDDVGVEGDPDELKFLITEKVSELHDEYNRLYIYPKFKEEMISEAVGGLYIPPYLGKDTARRIKADIRKALEEGFTGEEEAAEYFADVEAYGQELIAFEKELFFITDIR